MATMTGFTFHQDVFDSMFPGAGVTDANPNLPGGVPLVSPMQAEELKRVVKELAIAKAPVSSFDTGTRAHLRDTIDSDFDHATNVLSVFSDAPHACAVEYGMAARSFVARHTLGPSPKGRPNPLDHPLPRGTIVSMRKREPQSFLWEAMRELFPAATIPSLPGPQ